MFADSPIQPTADLMKLLEQLKNPKEVFESIEKKEVDPQNNVFSIEGLFLFFLNTSKISKAFVAQDIDVNNWKNLVSQKMNENFENDSPEKIVQRLMKVNLLINETTEMLQANKQFEFDVWDVLITLSAQPESFSFVNHLLSKEGLNQEAMIHLRQNMEEEQTEHEMEKLIPLLHRTGEPWVNRPEEISALARGLSRRQKNHLLLIGESGVGKTALLEGLASLASEHAHLPKSLQNLSIHRLELASLIAGANMRGDIERKFMEMEEFLEHQPNSALLIDDFHHFINLGAQGQMDPIGLLLPLMRRQKTRVLITLTPDRLMALEEKISGFLSQFQKVHLSEPDKTLSLQIASAYQSVYETHHQVSWEEGIIERAYQLSNRYLSSQRFPDKLLDVLDEASAWVSNEVGKKKIVSQQDVEKVVALRAHLPKEHLMNTDAEALKMLPDQLASKVFGQSQAIQTLTASIRRSRAGLGRGGKQKPTGVFFFAGPTGVGKTEIAKQLAETLAMPLVRIDMSEFTEPHTISKLIGSPPGYVGSQNGGQLVSAVQKQPCSVILLDEFEKAHASLHNLFLQVMDDGRLTDGAGHSVDFRQTILILTSNLGAQSQARQGIGFQATKQNANEVRDDLIASTLPPEFRNRIDAVVHFNSLNKQDMAQIVDRQLNQLALDAQERQSVLTFGHNLKKHLMEKGYDEKMGARPLLRLIEQEIATPLSEELLFGQLKEGGHIYLDWEKNQLVMKPFSQKCPVMINASVEQNFLHKK